MSKSDRNTNSKAAQGYVRRETMIAIAVGCLFVGYLAGSLLDNVRIGSSGGNSSFQAPPQAVAPAATSQPSGLESLIKQAENDPENAFVWSTLGNAYFDANRYGDAIAAYTRSLQLAPGNPNVLTDLGIMYRRSGDSGKAIEYFDQAISADPGHLMSRFNKGIVLLYDLRDRSGAIEAWQGLAAVAPTFTTPTGESISNLIKELKAQ